jgi:hypothetical protein
MNYALSNGYKLLQIFELHVFNTKVVEKLNNLCIAYNTLIEKSSSKLERKIIKSIQLSAIGRFALNLTKLNKEELITFPEKLFYNIDKLNYFDFFSSTGACYGSFKNNKKNKYFKFWRAKTNPIIFALICSTVKRLIHRHALSIHFSKNLSLIRLDTDCITLSLNSENSLKELYSILYEHNDLFKYKIEQESVRMVLSYRKQAYFIVHNDGSLSFKISGAILDNYQRYVHIFKNNDLTHLIESCLTKLNNGSRQLPRIALKPDKLNNGTNYEINSIPFGYKGPLNYNVIH